MHQQSRRDDMMRNLLNMMAMGMEKKTNEQRYQDQLSQQQKSNEMQSRQLDISEKRANDLSKYYDFQASKPTPEPEWKIKMDAGLRLPVKEKVQFVRKWLGLPDTANIDPNIASRVEKHFGMNEGQLTAMDPTSARMFVRLHFEGKKEGVWTPQQEYNYGKGIISASMKNVEQAINTLSQTARWGEGELNKVKPDIDRLNKQKIELAQFMVKKNLTKEDLDRIIQLGDIGFGTGGEKPPPDPELGLTAEEMNKF